MTVPSLSRIQDPTTLVSRCVELLKAPLGPRSAQLEAPCWKLSLRCSRRALRSWNAWEGIGPGRFFLGIRVVRMVCLTSHVCIPTLLIAFTSKCSVHLFALLLVLMPAMCQVMNVENSYVCSCTFLKLSDECCSLAPDCLNGSLCHAVCFLLATNCVLQDSS